MSYIGWENTELFTDFEHLQTYPNLEQKSHDVIAYNNGAVNWHLISTQGVETQWLSSNNYLLDFSPSE